MHRRAPLDQGVISGRWFAGAGGRSFMDTASIDRWLNEIEREREVRHEAERQAAQRAVDLAAARDEIHFFESVSSLLSAALTAPAALDHALALACQLLRWPVGHACRLNAVTGTLESGDAWHFADPTRVAPPQSLLPQVSTACSMLSAQALAAGAPVHVADLRATLAIHHTHRNADDGLQAGLALPIRFGDDILGVMAFLADAPATPTARQLALLEHLAGQVGRVLSRADELETADAVRARVDDEVRARTAALQEAKDTAENLAKAKSALLATMTHELRTPLSGVHGMASLLLDSALSESQRDHACHILSSTEALLSIVDDVLDYSRVESGRLQVEDTDYQPIALVDDVLALLGPRAADKRIELASQFDPSVPMTVGGDAGRVRQILVNLVGNALKFTAQGHVVVRVSLVTTDAATHLRFDVEDTGIGVAPEALPHLFQPFVQAEAATSRLFGGSGLGLSICRRFAEALGGAIGVASTPGAGSTFWFTVAAPRPTGHFLEPNRQLEGARILLMTRSAVVAPGITQLLQAAGATVEQARSSDQAVRLVRGNPQPFDAALIDLQQREARATAGGASFHALLGASCRVIALAHPWNKPNDGSASEVDAVVMTPIRHAGLLATITRLLNRASSVPVLNVAERFDGDLVGLKILVVDDNPVNQKVATTFLTKLGCQCALASNGREAVDAVSQGRFDLVLMDCQMPELDGFEATRIIRAQPRHQSLPIVAMTASAEPGIHERCLQAGMTDYLVKPVRPRLLAETLIRWTAGAPAA